MDPGEIGRKILEALEDPDRWSAWSQNGISGVHRRFSWKSHARGYLEGVTRAMGGLPVEEVLGAKARRHHLSHLDRILVTDVDDTLTGNPEALEAVRETLERAGSHVGFGIATGRTLERAVEGLRELGLRTPDILITASGTEIHYGDPFVEDLSWKRQINYRWEPGKVRESLLGMPGISPHGEGRSTPLRLRFRRDGPHGPSLAAIRRKLRRDGLRVMASLDHETDLDITPIRASPGLAIRFIAFKWNLAPDRILVAGDSGNDADMLSGETLGVVVANHTPELEEIRGRPRVYFAEGRHGWGVLEGIRHYDFLDRIRIPDEDND